MMVDLLGPSIHIKELEEEEKSTVNLPALEYRYMARSAGPKTTQELIQLAETEVKDLRELSNAARPRMDAGQITRFSGGWMVPCAGEFWSSIDPIDEEQ